MEVPRVSIFRNGVWAGCIMEVFKEIKALVSASELEGVPQQSALCRKEMGMNAVDLKSSESSEGIYGWGFGLVTVFLLNASHNFVA